MVYHPSIINLNFNFYQHTLVHATAEKQIADIVIVTVYAWETIYLHGSGNAILSGGR